MQEYVDKVSGKQEPKTLFLSWEEKCDVKSADIVKYFDSKVFPSESPGSGAMYPAQAPQSQFITPTTGPSVMDSSPMVSPAYYEQYFCVSRVWFMIAVPIDREQCDHDDRCYDDV